MSNYDDGRCHLLRVADSNEDAAGESTVPIIQEEMTLPSPMRPGRPPIQLPPQQMHPIPPLPSPRPAGGGNGAASEAAVPPEWAVLLLGCALGLATGASVVLFNLTVHAIHNMAWAGTPKDGAAWLRVQPLADTWHRILLIPVLGGVVVGLLHAVCGVIDQIRNSQQLSNKEKDEIDFGKAAKPIIKAVQAAVTLGTGSSLGPEGPSVDIGKSWAGGLAEILKNSKDRKVALIAAGAAAGIASGFNAAVSGFLFAIETVLFPLYASPSPLSVAMIMLAAVLSSAVSKVVLGDAPAFTVPEYELKTYGELPLYLILGIVCGIISIILTRLIAISTRVFDFLRERMGVPLSVTPAMGGLSVGVIALQYPGVLYWGFENVNEILHSRDTVTAAGPKLMMQLIAAKIVATSICKGSGLVGGIYAPSLFIGSAVGSVYGSLAGAAVNAAIPGDFAVAAPQAYALVGMAAMLAGVCSVPITSVLLLFELTKDYRIILPLMGAVGLSYWFESAARSWPGMKLESGGGGHTTQASGAGQYRRLKSAVNTRRGRASMAWKSGHQLDTDDDDDMELCLSDGAFGVAGAEGLTEEQMMEELKVEQVMSTNFATVSTSASLKEVIAAIFFSGQRCALVLDAANLLDGIITLSDLQREAMRAVSAMDEGNNAASEDECSMAVTSVCTSRRGVGNDKGLIVCYPDETLRAAFDLMLTRALRQLPVVARGGQSWEEKNRKVIGLLDRNSLRIASRSEVTRRLLMLVDRGHHGGGVSSTQRHGDGH